MKPIILTTFFLLLFSPFFSQVLINEYSCSNVTGITDAFGEREDWVELYNTGTAPLDLTGYYLSDKASNLTKWQIPSGSIAANGFKMIYCSKRNLVSGTQYHPNFNLKQTSNEWIILTNPSGVVVDSLKMIHMTKADHSIGRLSNGASEWKLFTTPTPAATKSTYFSTTTSTKNLTKVTAKNATMTISTKAGRSIQVTLPTVGSRNVLVRMTIKDPSGKVYTVATKTVAKNKGYVTPVIKFAKAGIYTMTIFRGTSKNTVGVRVAP
jgi:hypothetical protein